MPDYRNGRFQLLCHARENSSGSFEIKLRQSIKKADMYTVILGLQTNLTK